MVYSDQQKVALFLFGSSDLKVEIFAWIELSSIRRIEVVSVARVDSDRLGSLSI